MADLSDADKRILLGADYKRAEARRDAELGTTDQTRLAQSQKNKAEALVTGAIGIGIVAFVIGFANYFSRGTPYNSKLVIGCIVVVLASAAVVVFMRSRKAG